MSNWNKQFSLGTKVPVEELKKVLDPADDKGFKNCYLDYYSKYYLKKYLMLKKTDNVLEIGCGVGRITEYLAPLVNQVYGTDTDNVFIEQCNQKKIAKNSDYLKSKQISDLCSKSINKAFTYSVLIYIKENNDVIELLKNYMAVLPNLEKLLVFEQIKANTRPKLIFGSNEGKYRTIDEYKEIFAESGLKVEQVIITGEGSKGFFKKLLFHNKVYKYLPGFLFTLISLFFLIDKLIMDLNLIKREPFANDEHDYSYVDAIFLLSPKISSPVVNS